MYGWIKIFLHSDLSLIECVLELLHCRGPLELKQASWLRMSDPTGAGEWQFLRYKSMLAVKI